MFYSKYTQVSSKLKILLRQAATKKSVSEFLIRVLTVQDNMIKNFFVTLITFSTILNVFKDTISESYSWISDIYY